MNIFEKIAERIEHDERIRTIRIILTVLVFTWISATIVFWMINYAEGRSDTLLQVVVSQFNFVRGLRLW